MNHGIVTGEEPRSLPHAQHGANSLWDWRVGNFSLTRKRLHDFVGDSVYIFGKVNGSISPSASPPDREQHIKLTARASFAPTDNPLQLRTEVSSAELLKSLWPAVVMSLWRD